MAEFQIPQFDEVVRLPAEFVGDHQWVGAHGRHHRHPGAFVLNRVDQFAKVAIAGK